MKKLYTLIAGVTLALAVQAQCTVTFTYTTNGLTVNGNATGVGTAQLPQYGWDWGGQSIGVGQQASYTFASAGTYQVCAYFFDLLDTAGCNAVSCQNVAVTATSVTEIAPTVNTISASPNPFTNKLTIDYSLATAGDVEISVFDMTGKKVAVVAKDKMNPGHYELVWTPENLSSGIYFVQMNINGQVYTKKLVHTMN
jgi:hypothetical protein